MLLEYQEKTIKRIFVRIKSKHNKFHMILLNNRDLRATISILAIPGQWKRLLIVSLRKYNVFTIFEFPLT